jgi:hypothetical protein
MGMWLWLSVIAAGVTVAVVRARGRSRRERELAELCRRAGIEFAVVNPFADLALLPFPLFAPTKPWLVENVCWDARDVRVRVFDYRRTEASDPLTLSCGVVPLPAGMPPISVLPRGEVDRVHELASGGSVRLELDAFERRYDAHGSDPRAVVSFLDQRMMETILALPMRIWVYVRDDHLVLVSDTLPAPEMLLLLDAAHAIVEHVPSVVASLFPPHRAEGPFEARWLQGEWSPDPTSADAPNPLDLGG